MSSRPVGKVTIYMRGRKRLLDLALVLPALVLATPVMLLLSALVRAKLGRPVLFRQARPGLRGCSFDLLKFRTMTDRRDAEGRLLSDGERLTAFGRWMRKWSLDEVPELFNVLRGDMSLVGPRPLLMEYLDRYNPTQARRHEVKPGLTGWAQVNGRNAISWEEKFALDVWYVDNRSFLLDVKIIAMTIWKVVRGEGISAPGEATMPEFMGRTGTGKGT